MSQAMPARRILSAMALAAAACVGLTGVAWSATPPAVPAAAKPPVPGAPGAAPVAAAPAVAKSIWDQTPYPLYEQGDRVDPFTLGKPKHTEPVGSGGQGTVMSDAVAKVLGKSVRAYDEAEALLVSDRKERYALCAEACQKGSQELKLTIAEIGKDEQLVRFMEPARALMERFGRLEATSKRLKQRQDIEAEFAGLKITVDGIVWNEQSPAAAVNGQVAGEGSVLKLGAGGQDVQVYRIRRDAVVFVYKGVQVSVRLDRGGL